MFEREQSHVVAMSNVSTISKILKEADEACVSKIKSDVIFSKGGFTENSQPDSLTKQEAESPTMVNIVPRVPRLTSPFNNIFREIPKLKNCINDKKSDIFLNSPLMLKSPLLNFSLANAKPSKKPIQLQLRTTANANGPLMIPGARAPKSLTKPWTYNRTNETNGQDLGNQTERPVHAPRVFTQADLMRSKETPTAKLGFFSPNYYQTFNGFINDIVGLKPVHRSPTFELPEQEYGAAAKYKKTESQAHSFNKGIPQKSTHQANKIKLMKSTSTPHHKIFPDYRQYQVVQHKSQLSLNPATGMIPTRKIMPIFDSEVDPAIRFQQNENRNLDYKNLATDSEIQYFPPPQKNSWGLNLSQEVRHDSNINMESNGKMSVVNKYQGDSSKVYQQNKNSQNTVIQHAENQTSRASHTFINFVNRETHIPKPEEQNHFTSFFADHPVAPQRVPSPAISISRPDNLVNLYSRPPTFQGTTDRCNRLSTPAWTSPSQAYAGGHRHAPPASGQQLLVDRGQTVISQAFSFGASCQL